MKTQKTYTADWFQKRAFASLKKIAPHTWDYSDSLLLYIHSGEEAYESMQETGTPYFKMITKPEREYLAEIAAAVVRVLPNNFDYIDLGPGTEHKEHYFFDELKKQNKKFRYLPVDISKSYLRLAELHATSQGIPTVPMQTSFEELSKKLVGNTAPRFVSLGLTFSNYNPDDVCALLKKIAGVGGFIFIEAQMRDRIDMHAMQQVIADILDITDIKMALLGLNPKTEVSKHIVDDGIRAWRTIIHTNPALEKMGVTRGDKFLIFQSLRYTKNALEEALSKTNASYQLFDTGKPFIGAIIQS